MCLRACMHAHMHASTQDQAPLCKLADGQLPSPAGCCKCLYARDMCVWSMSDACTPARRPPSRTPTPPHTPPSHPRTHMHSVAASTRSSCAISASGSDAASTSRAGPGGQVLGLHLPIMFVPLCAVPRECARKLSPRPHAFSYRHFPHPPHLVSGICAGTGGVWPWSTCTST